MARSPVVGSFRTESLQQVAGRPRLKASLHGGRERFSPPAARALAEGVRLLRESWPPHSGQRRRSIERRRGAGRIEIQHSLQRRRQALAAQVLEANGTNVRMNDPRFERGQTARQGWGSASARRREDRGCEAASPRRGCAACKVFPPTVPPIDAAKIVTRRHDHVARIAIDQVMNDVPPAERIAVGGLDRTDAPERPRRL